MCASKATHVAVRCIVYSRTSGDCRLIDLELEPFCEWWADGDPFVYDIFETIVALRERSNISKVFESGSTLTAMPVAYVVSEQVIRLSGETWVDDRQSWQSDDSAVRG